MTSLVAVVDAGTTGVRSALVDERGRVVAQASAALGIGHPEAGAAEQSVDAMADAVIQTLHNAVEARPAGGEVVAVNVSAQRASVALVDEAGRPLTPLLLWMDLRGAQALDELAKIGPGEFTRISGLPFGAMPGITRLLWLRRSRPDIMARAARLVCVSDAMTSRLVGHATGVDVTSAAWTGLLDLDARKWSDRILAGLDIDSEILPDVVDSDATVGYIAKDVSRETGLPPGIPVFAGAGDQQCSSVGAGAWAVGSASLNLGTSATYVAPARRGDPTAVGMVRSAHVIDGLEDREGTIPSCGSSLRWLAETFGYGSDGDGYTRLAEEAALVPAGAEGLRIRALFAGAGTPTWTSRAASVDGLELRHGRAHFARAVLESIGAQFRHVAEAVDEVGQTPSHVTVIGGAARSPLICQILADISRQELIVPTGDVPVSRDTQLAALRGAAGIAWRSLGVDFDPGEQQSVKFTPAAATAAAADDIFDHLRAGIQTKSDEGTTE